MDSSTHAPFVERFNYTIQTKISKYICSNNSYTFYKDFDKLVENYNNSFHNFLKLSPNQAELQKYETHVQLMHAKKFMKYTKKFPRYTVGQTVRVSKQKTKFGPRGYEPQFSNERFIIVDINETLPIPMYILKSIDSGENDPIEGRFYEREIFAIEDE